MHIMHNAGLGCTWRPSATGSQHHGRGICVLPWAKHAAAAAAARQLVTICHKYATSTFSIVLSPALQDFAVTPIA
jgi:hypothetical protein